MLLGQDATADAVMGALRNAVLSGQPNDVLLVYFAGHGLVSQWDHGLAAALRGWVLRRPVATTARLTVRLRGLDLRLELSPNISRAEILAALQPLLEKDDDGQVS